MGSTQDDEDNIACAMWMVAGFGEIAVDAADSYGRATYLVQLYSDTPCEGVRFRFVSR
jgi:hypothetical protein